jgi:hypothetical protein
MFSGLPELGPGVKTGKGEVTPEDVDNLPWWEEFKDQWKLPPYLPEAKEYIDKNSQVAQEIKGYVDADELNDPLSSFKNQIEARPSKEEQQVFYYFIYKALIIRDLTRKGNSEKIKELKEKM